MLIETGALRGMQIHVDPSTRKATRVSTRNARDSDRFQEMPSLAPTTYSLRTDLQVLDLHNCRYITDLHESVGDLENLECLYLTSCFNLQRLPHSLGRLSNLTELVLTDSPSVSELPDSISELKRYVVVTADMNSHKPLLAHSIFQLEATCI